MFARRTLLQLTTKLAIGVGALFLVGVLLAAIPNHRAPVVAGASAQASQDTQGSNPVTVPEMKADETKAQEKASVQNIAQKRTISPKAGDSSR